MNIDDAIKILKYHQAWRTGEEGFQQQHPAIITKAINVIINEYETTRKGPSKSHKAGFRK